MVVLTAIGRFFKKIWDWIKQTAWIQPLLIVGIIFGVIFSIPSIVKAVNAGKKENSTYNIYYHNFKYSLEGAAESKADKFTTRLAEICDPSKNEAAEAEFKKEYPELGNKFFVAFVAKDCEECEKAKEGFSTFQKKFNINDAYLSETDKNDEVKETFQLVTIFTDDENEQTEENVTAFSKYLERHQGFFEDAASVAWELPYFHEGKLEESSLNALADADPDNFLAPTIMLFELKDKAAVSKRDAGVTEVMFGVEGDDKNAKARTLLDCWNHTNDFSDNKQSK